MLYLIVNRLIYYNLISYMYDEPECKTWFAISTVLCKGREMARNLSPVVYKYHNCDLINLIKPSGLCTHHSLGIGERQETE